MQTEIKKSNSQDHNKQEPVCSQYLTNSNIHGPVEANYLEPRSVLQTYPTCFEAPTISNFTADCAELVRIQRLNTFFEAEGHLYYTLPPKPERVYLPGLTAEQNTWEHIRRLQAHCQECEVIRDRAKSQFAKYLGYAHSPYRVELPMQRRAYHSNPWLRGLYMSSLAQAPALPSPTAAVLD